VKSADRATAEDAFNEPPRARVAATRAANRGRSEEADRKPVRLQEDVLEPYFPPAVSLVRRGHQRLVFAGGLGPMRNAVSYRVTLVVCVDGDRGNDSERADAGGMREQLVGMLRRV